MSEDFVDVTWRHIGEGERFGVGLRGTKGTAGINPLHVWKEIHGMPHDVSPTGQPYLVLRLGLPAPGDAPLPRTPRLPDHETITVSSTAPPGHPWAGTVPE